MSARASSVSVAFLAGGVACGGAQSGGLVTAPSSPPPVHFSDDAPHSTAPADAPVACDRRWNLDVIGGDGRVVVVCPNDVRRQAIGDSATIAQSLSPALDPARDKVCACVARLRAPAFVDLVFTARPEEGRVTVQAGGDDDLDPELGPPFIACVGTVVATYAPLAAAPEECSLSGKVAFIYPVRLDLAP